MLSADTVRALKTAPAAYRHVASTMQVDLDEIRLVAAHAWDVSGALAAGCRAAFVRRPGFVPSPRGPEGRHRRRTDRSVSSTGSSPKTCARHSRNRPDRRCTASGRRREPSDPGTQRTDAPRLRAGRRRSVNQAAAASVASVASDCSSSCCCPGARCASASGMSTSTSMSVARRRPAAARGTPGRRPGRRWSPAGAGGLQPLGHREVRIAVRPHRVLTVRAGRRPSRCRPTTPGTGRGRAAASTPPRPGPTVRRSG